MQAAFFSNAGSIEELDQPLAQEPKVRIEKDGQRFVEPTNVTEDVWGPMKMKGKKTEEQV